MRKTIKLIILIGLIMLMSYPAIAWETGAGWDEYNFRVPGTLRFQSTIYASGHNSGATTLSSGASHLLAAQLVFGLINFDISGSQSREIADGSPGQMVTIRLTAKSGVGNFVIEDSDTGITKTGWSAITFDNAGDSVTLLWLDDTNGWIIIGHRGCTF